MTAGQPLVSVIMPAYNAERYIAASIQSALDQTYSNWELVVVDDGSTDGTRQVVQQFTAVDNRIKYFFQENGRLGKARNTGIKNSSGPLIAFLDSDDLWMAEKLRMQLAKLESSDVDVVFSNGFVFNEDDVTSETETFPIVTGRFEGNEMLDLLLAHNRIPVLSVLIRRKALEDAGAFEESLPYHGCEDYDLWVKLAKRGATFYGMEEKLVRYRRHPSSMTHKLSHGLKLTIRVLKRHINDGVLSEDEKKRRLRDLYRALIAALVEEGDVAEAGNQMKELSSWDRSGLVTFAQKVLLKISPGSFNRVSKVCLYRIEWHLMKLKRVRS
jgi:teichuronic acid biosynthesis glycosyltransferase TuaG